MIQDTNEAVAVRRAEFLDAMEQGHHAQASRIAIFSLWERVIRVLADQVHLEWHKRPESAFEIAASVVVELNKFIEQEGRNASPELLMARNACVAIAETEAILEGKVTIPDNLDLIGKLIICGAALGHAEVNLALKEVGHWDDYSSAKFKLYKIGSAQRGRQAEWEASFAPTARAFCEDKAQVSLGQLARRARTWAEGETTAGRNPGLPGTDEGIKAGLRRMEDSGELTIPGRVRGAVGE